MNKIEVGMMVEIVATPEGATGPESQEAAEKYHGHIGRVLKKWDTHPIFGDRWEVEGADPDGTIWTNRALRPIDPPEEKASWEAIEKTTGWSPMREKEAS